MESLSESLDAADNRTDPNAGDAKTVYSLIMLCAVVLPGIVLNSAIVVSQFCLKSTPLQIRMILISILGSDLFIAFGLMGEYLLAIITLFDNEMNIITRNKFCSVILWTITSGGAAYLVFITTFAIVAFMYVCSKEMSTSKGQLFLALISIWLLALILTIPMLIAANKKDQKSNFIMEEFCFPNTSGKSQDWSLKPKVLVFLLLWNIMLGVLPLVITIMVTLLLLCFVYFATKSEEAVSNRNTKNKIRVVKLTMCFIVCTAVKFAGNTMLLVVAAKSKELANMATVYSIFTIISLGLWIAPTAILACDRNTRLLCCCKPGDGYESLPDTNTTHTRGLQDSLV